MTTAALTCELLRDLYSVQLLTEQDIATAHGTTQVQVGRLRKRWGIPTLGKAARLTARLPSLTDEQRSVLVGSLLGDGHLMAPSEKTARLVERHSTTQEPYLRWKAGLLGPLVSSVYTVQKKDAHTGKVYAGVEFATHSLECLHPYYDLFYPAPDRKRVFPASLGGLLTPLALAVWFMDDGSCGPRISFGLDDTSLHRVVSALRGLGLRAQVSGNRGNMVLSFPRCADRFHELVAPHVPACMTYKLTPGTPRRTSLRVSAGLSLERVQELYSNGVPLAGIARTLGVGTSTVRRKLLTAPPESGGGVPLRSMGRPRKGYTKVAADVALSHYTSEVWATLTDPEREVWVQEVVSVLRRTPFPYAVVPTPAALQGELAALRKVGLQVDLQGWLRPWSTAGTRMVGAYFPHRYQATSRTKHSAYEAWHMDAPLSRAVRFQLDNGDPVLPHRVLRALTLHYRTPTVFRPTVARYLYETFCPPRGRVWDCCSGYGGRVMGAVAAGVTYIGTDVDPQTVEGNEKLALELGASATVQVVCSPAEKYDPGPVDFVFTSPPYFDQERYSHNAEQSWVQYGTSLEAWVEGFLRPIVRTSMRVLPVGGHMALNVADVRQRGKVVPLVEAVIATALQEGFVLARTLYMPLARVNRAQHAGSEPVLLFQK